MIDVHVFDFGSLPIFDIKDINNPVFFVVKKDSLTFTLCGLGTVDTIKNNLINANMVKSSVTKNLNFIGFKFLKHIDSLKIK